MAMYKWASSLFASAPKIYVMYEYLDLISQHVVTIGCSKNMQADIKYYTGKDSIPGRLISVEGKEYKSKAE